MPETLIDVVERTSILDKEPENPSRTHDGQEDYKQKVEEIEIHESYSSCSDQE